MVNKPGSESEALLCHLGQFPHPRRPPFPSAHWRENTRPYKPSRCWDCMGKGWADARWSDHTPWLGRLSLLQP